jgi:hypothetical protein
MAQSGIPLSEWSGSGATRELHETIKKQIEANDKQFRKSILWSKIAVIAAIVAVILALIQIAVSVYPLINTHEPEKPGMLRRDSKNQQPTKNIVPASSSNTDQGSSIISKKTSTYNVPYQKRK